MSEIIERQQQWPIIDKIYSNITEAKEEVETDNILLGRFILIKYSDEELKNDRKLELMLGYPTIDLESIDELNTLNENEKEFLRNWRTDTINGNTAGIDKDRLVLQKNAFYNEDEEKYELEYKEIAYLTWTDLGETNTELVNLNTTLTQEIADRGALQDRVEFFLDSEEVKDTIDTLHELNNWIDTHGDHYTGVLNSISALEAAQKYTNNKPLKADLGGIQASAYPNGFSEKPIKELFDELLYPYIAPNIDNIRMYDGSRGIWKDDKAVYDDSANDEVHITKIKFDIELGSEDLTEIKLLSTNDNITPIENQTSYEFDFSSTQTINQTTNFSIRISDGKETIEKTATLYFYYPSYYGVITTETEINDGNIINSIRRVSKLEGPPTSGGTREQEYTRFNVDECLFYAYPKSYGTLSKIIDPNSFSQTWQRYDIKIHEQDYYVYVSGNASGDLNSKYRFKFA